jgi:hypothetical protein
MAHEQLTSGTKDYKHTLRICNNFLFFHCTNGCATVPQCYPVTMPLIWNMANTWTYFWHSCVPVSLVWLFECKKQDANIFDYLFLKCCTCFGRLSAHHQQHVTVQSASGTVSQYCCRLLAWMKWNAVPSQPQYLSSISAAIPQFHLGHNTSVPSRPQYLSSISAAIPQFYLNHDTSVPSRLQYLSSISATISQFHLSCNTSVPSWPQYLSSISAMIPQFHLSHNTSVPSHPRYRPAAVLVDNTWSWMYSYVLLMIGGGTARNI